MADHNDRCAGHEPVRAGGRAGDGSSRIFLGCPDFRHSRDGVCRAEGETAVGFSGDTCRGASDIQGEAHGAAGRVEDQVRTGFLILSILPNRS